MEYKYTLIVSQYYHSRHFFIVKFEDDFIQRATKMASELEDYKRNDNRKLFRKELGDLEYRKYDPKIHYRYNINDDGDIYFFNQIYVDRLMYTVINYHMDEYYSSRGYIRKKMKEEIHKHHDYETIKSIVEKYFEII